MGITSGPIALSDQLSPTARSPEFAPLPSSAGERAQRSASGEYGEFIGCYHDSNNGIFETGPTRLYYSSNSLEECKKQCSGYTYMILEFGYECGCANSLANAGTKLADNECNRGTSGARGTSTPGFCPVTHACGDANKVSVSRIR